MKKLSLLFVLLVSASLVFGQANGLVISNKASGGAIGTAAATVDVASLFNVNQTTASQTLTVPNLTNATNGKTIHINNVGSTAFTLLSKTIEPGTGILLRWTGSAWSISGVGNATGGGGEADSAIFATQYDISLKVDKSNNLSDLPSSSTARTNLGLGSSATANVGTTAGTVAAGDDSRFTAINSNTQSALDGKQPINNQCAISGSTVDWNCTHLYKTLTANTTLSFVNAANARTIVVYITYTISNNYTFSWSGTIDWGGVGPPSQRASGTTVTDVYTFIQINGVIQGRVSQ